MTGGDVPESTVLAVLNDPHSREWSIQGFGMLRTYLDDGQVHRLHIWDPSRANEEVSTIHDHPWDFTSRIYSGLVGNVRYVEDDGSPALPLYRGATIRCGVGGGILNPGPATWYGLREQPDEHAYGPGDTYGQEAPELHESQPSPGAVTVISRTFKAERDIARVFWPTGEWVTAEPRPATQAEVDHFVALALSRWGRDPSQEIVVPQAVNHAR